MVFHRNQKRGGGGACFSIDMGRDFWFSLSVKERGKKKKKKSHAPSAKKHQGFIKGAGGLILGREASPSS